MTESNEKDPEEQVIELSDIAVGTSMEDEAIIELTEEVVDEARNGISGATREGGEDSSELELDREIYPDEQSGQAEGTGPIEGAESPKTPEADLSHEVEDIARELDDYFPADKEPGEGAAEKTAAPGEQAPQPGAEIPASFTQEQLEAALERVIEKKYANIIERMINEAIEQRLLEDIDQIKEFILNRNAGP